MRSSIVAAVIVVLAVRVHGESAKLVAAREAIDAVRYNEAQPLLQAALDAGGNSQDELIEIYRLSAITATVLGRPDVAEQFYRRWLAIVPTAVLPDTVAPKLREPFKAAQAYMATRGHLSARAQRRTEHQIDVIVDADPLAMAASISIDGAGQRLGADRRAHFERPSSAPVVEIAVLDEAGNHLMALPLTDLATTERVQVDTRAKTSAGLVRNPIVWAVPAVAVAAVGIGFGVAAGRAQGEVDDILAHRDQHFFTELETTRARRDRDALLANVGFVAGGALAAVAVVMTIVRPHARVAIVPAKAPGGAVLVLSRTW